MRKPTFWFPTWSDTSQAVQLQKMSRGLKFRIWKVEVFTVGNHVTIDVMLNPIMGAAILIFYMPNDGFCLLMR